MNKKEHEKILEEKQKTIKKQTEKEIKNDMIRIIFKQMKKIKSIISDNELTILYHEQKELTEFREEQIDKLQEKNYELNKILRNNFEEILSEIHKIREEE